MRIFALIFCLLTSLISANEQELLDPQTEAEIVRVIQEEAPDIEMQSIKIISEGWDNIVAEVNEKWIFRFPRHEEMRRVLPQELALLNLIKEHITLAIPDFQRVGVKTCFAACPKIEGIRLSGDGYRSLKEEQKQSIAEQLANFATELHGIVSIDIAKSLGYHELNLPLFWIEENVVGTLEDEQIETMVSEALQVLKGLPDEKEHWVFVHNDLHGGNFHYDPEHTQITGIFDFSDAVIAHPATEFCKMIQIDPDLMIRGLTAYGCESDIPRASAEHVVRRCFYLIHWRQKQNIQKQRHLMRQLYEFLPFWDSLKAL